MADMTDVRMQLELSRRGLLDISMRNPLLNYRPLKARGLEFIEADILLLFRYLVREGKDLSFLATGKDKSRENVDLPLQTELSDLTPETDSNTDSNYETFDEALARLDAFVKASASVLTSDSERLTPTPAEKVLQTGTRMRDTGATLKTSYSPNEMLKRLDATEDTYKTFIEEQGVNALYLTMGTLTWFETAPGEQARNAPLILIPVVLKKIGPNRFGLSYSGDDIGINECLAVLLQTNFDLKLPDLPHAENEAPHVEDIDVFAYLTLVEKSIEANPSWKVNRDDCNLAFFSFSKLRMYYDLDEKYWPKNENPANHPIISSLLVTGFQEPVPLLNDEDHLDDKLNLQDLRTVMDADSSQVLAVEEIKQGRNLVIQGPPGTGKSQTITNILAEALGQGKKVLFVAEKMAALEVVKRRLDSLGLGVACLELHSNKTNKKSVLSQLESAHTSGKPIQRNVAQDTALLSNAQERLNRYARIVNSPVSVSGMTLFQIYGEWLRSETELRLLSQDDKISAPEMIEGMEAIAAKETSVFPRLEIPDLLQRDALNIRQCEQLIQELQSHVAMMGVPEHHPYWGSKIAVFLPTDANALSKDANAALTAIRELTQESSTLATQLDMASPETPVAAEALAHAVQRANAAPPFVGVQLGVMEWVIYRSHLESLIQKGKRLQELKRQYINILTPEAWELEINDLLEIRQTISQWGVSFFRYFSGDWRKSLKRLSILSADGRTPKEHSHQLERIDALLEYRRTQKEFRNEEQRGQALFAAQWQGENSDWNVLSHLLEWIVDLHSEIGGGKVPKAFLDFLVAGPDLKQLNTKAEQVLRAIIAARDMTQQCLRRLEMPQSENYLSEQSLSIQERRCALWATSTERVTEIITFNNLAERLTEAGLSAILASSIKWEGAGTGLRLAFRRSYLEDLLRFAYQQNPELASFNGSAHAKILDEFRDLDKKHLENNRTLLAETHWNNLPPLDGGGEVGILKREFQKKTRHLPLRKLMEQAGRAIQAIKPIFMMSPLSVATYLPPGQIHFDLVVFDEASQIEPVDALGALLRGKQAVVVGDSKQLPPTSFFSKLDNGANDAATTDLESVLGLFKSKGAPEKMLKWHYRSRHESLIAVSNQEFYGNSLVLFPSPDSSRKKLGLFYHYLPETIYDGGGNATNYLEARVVAEAVIRHARQQLHKSESSWSTLGVVAFSVSQMQTIKEHIELLRRQNPDCEPYFRADGNEPFFVKNLENVQGDERDIIYISIGYGKDKNGKVAMNFGPLNRDGGQRRLNVLITRARQRCEVFTNLSPDDIDLTRTNSAGVITFKQFLTYAKTGEFPTSSSSRKENNFSFEDEIVTVIKSLGYEVMQNVGCAGYFVDIGIKDPHNAGTFVLGVECDGAMYSSARSARDRDRLRNTVLSRMGWRIHRIWSTDWINRRDFEIKRLTTAITTACHEAEVSSSLIEADDISLPQEAHSVVTTGNTSAESIGINIIPRQIETRSLAPLPEYICQLLPPVNDSIYNISRHQLATMAVQIVQTESPVAVSEVVRRMGEAFQAGRITEKFRATAIQGVSLALEERKVIQRGDFLWAPVMQTPPLRSRANLENRARQIELVAPEEIQAAVQKVLRDSYSLPEEEVSRAVSRLFGIERLTAESKAHLDRLIDLLIQENVLKRQNGQISLK